MYAFPGVPEGEIRVINGDEFNLEPEPFAVRILLRTQTPLQQNLIFPGVCSFHGSSKW
jgi:hypothetical protein